MDRTALSPVLLRTECNNKFCFNESGLPLPYENDFFRAYVPNGWHRGTVRERTTALEGSMTRIDEEIDKLQEEIDVLRVQRHLYEDAHNGLRYSPFRALPAEIHLLIFQLACDNFVPEGYLAVSLVITSVCHRWRQLALYCPRMWTTIYASVDTLASIHKPPSASLVNLHLQRSGDLPLAVYIMAFDPNKAKGQCYDEHSEASKHWYPHFARLYKDFARWELADLILTQVEMRRLDKFINGAALPRLRSLKLVLTDDKVAYQPYKTFLKAPLLTSVHTRADTLRLPWNQIERFTACSRRAQDISAWLRFCENKDNHLVLNSLMVDFIAMNRASHTLPISLTSLTVDLSDTHGPAGLSLYKMPMLKELNIRLGHLQDTSQIGNNDSWNYVVPMDVPCFLEKSQCDLEAFSFIVDSAPTDEDTLRKFKQVMKTHGDSLLAILGFCSHLKSLKVVESPVYGGLLTPDFLNSLDATSKSTTCLPSLQCLELVASQSFDSDLVIQVLQSRIRKGIGEKNMSSVTVGLRGGKEVSDGLMDCLNDLRCWGIRTALW